MIKTKTNKTKKKLATSEEWKTLSIWKKKNPCMKNPIVHVLLSGGGLNTLP